LALGLCLLGGALAHAQPAPSREPRRRSVTVTGSPVEVRIETGTRTVFVFAVPIRGEAVEVDRARIQVVDTGGRSLIIEALDEPRAGERWPLRVPLADGRATAWAEFALVAHPSEVDTEIEVARKCHMTLDPKCESPRLIDKDVAMRSRICIALLFLLSACATMDPTPGEWEAPPPGEFEAPSPRLANLQRAALYPWTDNGQCVVQEASNEWPILAERCFYALERDRMRFRDVTKKCAVAQADAAAPFVVAICIFAAPEIVVGAVVVIGTVAVAALIQEAINNHQRNASLERAKPKTQTQPAKEPLANRAPKPKGSSTGDIFPPPPETKPRSPSCEPIPVPHAGGDDAHNECSDKFPPNRYPGMDVFVGGERFDALQVGVRVLWEIKTHQFDTYNAFVQRQEIEKEYEQVKEERKAAEKCGYDFIIGVSTQAHREALLQRDRTLNIVVTGCPR
jgi:hypothetical protein